MYKLGFKSTCQIHHNHTDELIYKINCGRFSKSNVKMAPNTNNRRKANNILPTYRKFRADCDAPFMECDSSTPCKGATFSLGQYFVQLRNIIKLY